MIAGVTELKLASIHKLQEHGNHDHANADVAASVAHHVQLYCLAFAHFLFFLFIPRLQVINMSERIRLRLSLTESPDASYAFRTAFSDVL